MNSDNKIISLEEALSFIKSGDHVVTGLGAGEAKLFLENLHTIADRVNNVTITNSDLCCQQRRKTFGRFHQAA